jgi:alanyl-tRNA synthetase
VLKETLSKKIKTIKEIKFLACEVDLDAQGMKDLAFEMGTPLESAIIVFASQKTGKPLLSCYISKDLVANDGKNAVTIIKILGKFIQGGGGGQAFYATAGGKNIAGIQEAIKAAENICIN